MKLTKDVRPSKCVGPCQFINYICGPFFAEVKINGYKKTGVYTYYLKYYLIKVMEHLC